MLSIVPLSLSSDPVDAHKYGASAFAATDASAEDHIPIGRRPTKEQHDQQNERRQDDNNFLVCVVHWLFRLSIAA